MASLPVSTPLPRLAATPRASDPAGGVPASAAPGRATAGVDGCGAATAAPIWARLRRAGAAVAADLRCPTGYTRHVGYAALTAGVGAGALQAAAATGFVLPTAALAGAALTLQVAVPGLLLLSAVLVRVDGAWPMGALMLPAVASRLAIALSVAVGLGLAPLVGASSLAPLAARLVVAAGLGAPLLGHAAWLTGAWKPGLDAATLGLVGLGAAAAPVAFALAAGTGLGLAIGSGLAVGTLVCGGLTLHAYLFVNRGQQAFSPYANGHVVPPTVVRAHRADDGPDGATVHAVPPALQDKIARMRAALLWDEEGRPYFLGMPVVLLEGPPGCGKTAMGHAIAAALDADLLRASAATLGRVWLPNYDTAVTRALTLVGQAELRALRTGRLQVVLLDEVGAALKSRLDVASATGLAHLQALGTLAYMLAMQNSRRNGVVLVLADGDLMACRDALLAVSPQQPIRVHPPTGPQLEAIFATALQRMLHAFAADWKLAVDGTVEPGSALAALGPRVATLAAAGGVGRHAVGVVARMRRDAEASLVGVSAHRRDVDATRTVMATAGERAVAWYAEALTTTRPLPPARPPAPTALPDAAEMRGSARHLLAQVAQDPLAAVLSATGAQATSSLDAAQTVNYFIIETSAVNTLTQIVDRPVLDLASSTQYWRAVQATQSAAMQAQGEGREPDPHGPTTHFADVTLPPYPITFMPLLEPSTRLGPTGAFEPDPALPPPLAYLIRLRQRQDGLRRDTYRSEHLYETGM